MENRNSKIFTLKYPIIQGGMGVGISLSSLAGSVAKNGCMGVISTANIGFKKSGFFKNPNEMNLEALHEEIYAAREISQGNGLLAVNIMTVINQYKDLVKYSVKSGIDAIISGAGLPLNLAELTENSKVMIAPIVSSARACEIIIRKWLKSSNRLPDFIVAEGKGAGGHLGFSKEDIEGKNHTLESISKSILEVVRKYEKKYGVKIPLFVGGSVHRGEDIKRYRDLGAYGVQMGTRFIATRECDAHENFKNLLVNSKKEDLRIIESPVGLLGRAIYTKLFERLEKVGRITPKTCINCIKTCDPKTTKYCITKALISGAHGDIENGLFFSGENVGEIKNIVGVKELIEELARDGGMK